MLKVGDKVKRSSKCYYSTAFFSGGVITAVLPDSNLPITVKVTTADSKIRCSLGMKECEVEKIDGGCNQSDGLSASYYELPEGATELYHLIVAKNMNAQVGEAFRSLYRYGESSHSDQLRDCNKVIAYMQQEKERLTKRK